MTSKRSNGASRRTRHRYSAQSILFLLWIHSVGYAATPVSYHVLSPQTLTGNGLTLMSLEANNTVTVDGQPLQLTLQENQRRTLATDAFTSGSVIAATGFLTLGSDQDAVNLPVPDAFAGTAFVVPQVVGDHRYSIQAASATAQVTILIGAVAHSMTVSPGSVLEYDAGSTNGVSALITSDVAILVSHTAYVNAVARSAYPVPPAATDLLGVHSQFVAIGAQQSGTVVTVYADNGAINHYTINAGGIVAVGTGSDAALGRGSALHIVASAPVAAIQYDSGGGNDATAFLSTTLAARHYGIPVASQYVTVACTEPGTVVTLYEGSLAPQTQTCAGSTTAPGKAYFGPPAPPLNPGIPAGAIVIASNPVYLIYGATASADMHNSIGFVTAPNSGSPVLDSVASPSQINPQPVTGTAAPNVTVRLYINDQFQSTTTASASGAYSFNAPLVDAANVLYTTAVSSGGIESDPSNVVTLQYDNLISRTQGGAISTATVWTPGVPASPYTITQNLTIANGASLTLQPGTALKFAAGVKLVANGLLNVHGMDSAPVTLTGTQNVPGSWTGIVLNSTAPGSDIDHAVIQWAQTGVEINAANGVTVSNSTIENATTNGIYVHGGVTAQVVGNSVANVVNSAGLGGACLYYVDGSGVIRGNTLSGCGYGIRLQDDSSPTIGPLNIITSNATGVDLGGDRTGARPNPKVNGNSIYGNSNGNVFIEIFPPAGTSPSMVNFQQNWWGTTQIGPISATIFAGGLAPYADWSNFLDGPQGAVVTGHYLVGPLSASMTLTSGTFYDALDTVIVNAGQTLTIQPGVAVRFYQPNAELLVNGVLNVNGSATRPDLFTLGSLPQRPGAWGGLVLNSGASNSVVNYAHITWAFSGIYLAGAKNVTVSHSTIARSSVDGVRLDESASGTLYSNIITNTTPANQGNCINVQGSTAEILGNTLTQCTTGVLVSEGSNATVHGGNTITDNQYGVTMQGSPVGSPTTAIVVGNNILGNSTYNVYTTGYSPSPVVQLNFNRNWWGSTSPAAIAPTIYDRKDSIEGATVNWMNFLDAPEVTPTP